MNAILSVAKNVVCDRVGNRGIIATLHLEELRRRMTMAPAIIDQYFDKALPIQNNTVLTVTEVPDCEEKLLKLLESAMLRGFDNHARLTEIHLPMERFPFMDSKFWHVPIEDCGKAQVLRFFFEHPDAEAH